MQTTTTYKWNSVNDFAGSIKQKYPEYKDMNDAELTQKMITKYPVYKEQIKEFAPPPPVVKPKDKFLSPGDTKFHAGIGTGALKSGGEIVKSLGQLGDKFATGVGLQDQDQYSEEALKEKAAKGDKIANLLLDENLAPKNKEEKLGKTAADIAEFFIPAGEVNKIEKILATNTGEKLLAKLIPHLGEKNAARVAKAAELGIKATVRAGEGGGIVALQNQGEGAGEAGVISAAFPVAGAGFNAIKTAQKPVATKMINSLIKPLLKDFSYGKNPGRAVAEEGIVANSLDELGDKIGVRRGEIGGEIGEVMASPEATAERFNLTKALDPLGKALKEAKKNPRTNQGLIQRLQDLTDDLLGKVESEGKTTYNRKLSDTTAAEAFEFKKDIADLTKFTGNASDDKAINKALKSIYGNIKGSINAKLGDLKSASGKTLKELNEKYADLSSAEIATKYRDKIEARQNMVKVGPLTSGFGTAFITAMATGGAAVPALLTGAGVGVLQELLSTPRVKTRVAKWLASSTPAEKQKLYKAIPALKGAIIETFVGK